MKRILVIEDKAPMRRNIALILELEGFEVATAEHGLAGLESVRARRPDLILCDIMMPGMDGHAVVRALRETPETATIPFIFLTARSDRSDVRTGMNFGADDYLTKPIVAEDLLAAVQARLARAQAHVREVQAAAKTSTGFRPDFRSPDPLRASLNLSPREAEVLLWVAQGKTNADVATILGIAEATVKQHMTVIFQKLGVESRNAATVRALEALSAASSSDPSKRD